MGKKKKQYTNEVKDLVRQILKDNSNISLVDIGKKLSENNKPFSDKPLSRIVSEIKNEQPEIEQPTATTTGDSTSEYDDNPDIAKLNANLLVLESDFKNTKSGDERRKIMTAICLTRESKIRMQKTLKEKDAISVNAEVKKYNIIFSRQGHNDIEVVDVEFDRYKKLKSEFDAWLLTRIKQPFFKIDEKQKPLPIEEKKDDDMGCE